MTQSMTDPQANKPTIGPASATGRKAEHIFEGAFPEPEWLARKQLPDVHIDYLVEAVENGQLTGRQFAAQVKGTQQRKGQTGQLKFSAKTKQVRYWLNDCRHPVFVFLINVVTGKGHWLFVQGFAKAEIAPSALQKQTKITLRFNPDDSLENIERFKASFRKAEAYVKDLHPGSVEAALAYKREALQRKDPRLNYHITATEQKQTIQLIPKESFPVGIVLPRDDAPVILKELGSAIASGAEFKFPRGKVKLKGSPVFDDFNALGGEVVIRCGFEAPGQVILTRQGVAGAKSFVVDGKYRVGTKSVTFQSRLAGAPISVGATLAMDDTFMTWDLLYQVETWENRQVLQLPYFDQLHELLDAIANGGGIRSDFIMRGTSIAEGVHTELNVPEIQPLVRFVSWLARCRSLASRFQVNPVLPPFRKITEHHWEFVDDLLALSHGAKRMVPMPQFSIEGPLEIPPEIADMESVVACAMVTQPDGRCDLLGAPVVIDPFRIVYTNVKITPTSSYRDGGRLFRIEGTSSTQRLVEFI